MHLKKIILIGTDIFFPDSLLFFIEKHIDIIIVQKRHLVSPFRFHPDLLQGLGATVIYYEKDDFFHRKFDFDRLSLDSHTMILSGPNLAGPLASMRVGIEDDDLSLYEIWLLQALASYNRKNSCGAMFVRFSNGDTAFATKEVSAAYQAAVSNVDLLLFDNDQLRDFVLYNNPALRHKRSLLAWVEGPLKRHVRKNHGRSIEFISMGRIFSNSKLAIPVVTIPGPRQTILCDGKQITLRARYDVAFGQTYQSLLQEREAFATDLQGAVFGLSHIDDVFNGSSTLFTKYRDLFFSLEGQILAHSPSACTELYYSFCNCPSKILAYLMFGIIPVLPHVLNNVNKNLVDKRMAVKVECQADLERIRKMSDSEIEEYRYNIFEYSEVYTFDPIASLLISEFEEAQTSKIRRQGCCDWDSVADDEFNSLIRKVIQTNEETRKAVIQLRVPYRPRSSELFLAYQASSPEKAKAVLPPPPPSPPPPPILPSTRQSVCGLWLRHQFYRLASFLTWGATKKKYAIRRKKYAKNRKAVQRFLISLSD